jgi:hypothetical protein
MNGWIIAQRWRRLGMLVVVATAFVLAWALLASGSARSAGKVTITTGFTIPAEVDPIVVPEGVHVVVTARAVRRTQHTVRLMVPGKPNFEAPGFVTDDECSNTAKTITKTATDVVENKTTTFTITWTGPNIGPC